MAALNPHDDGLESPDGFSTRWRCTTPLPGTMKITPALILLSLLACQPDSSGSTSDDRDQPAAPADLDRTQPATADLDRAQLDLHGGLDRVELLCPEGSSPVGHAPPLGQEIACATSDGALHGRAMRWSPDGLLTHDGHYRRGLKHGPWLLYHPRSTREMAQGDYDNDKKHGPWRYFHKNGAIKEEALYDRGALVEMRHFERAPPNPEAPSETRPEDKQDQQPATQPPAAD